MTYWQTYRPWLLRLLSERIYLSQQRGYCPDLLTIAVCLKKLIDYNGYRSDAKLAAFITRKQREIRTIIPSNNAHEKQIEKLNSALREAEAFQGVHSNWPNS